MANTLDKKKSLSKNIKIYYALQFFGQLSFTSAIWTFFLTVFHNFTYTEAFIIYLISAVVTLFLEIPSGAWADRFGRKKLYIFGSFCIFLEMLIWIFAKNFWLFIFAGILLGIGYAIKSGNFSSLLHDNLGENGKEKEFKNVTANGHIALFVGRIPAAIGAGFLYALNPLYPVVLTAFFLFIVVIISLFIYEPKQEFSIQKSNSLQIRAGFNTILENRFTKFLVIVLILQGALSNIYWFTYQPFFEELGIKIEYIGVIFAIVAILSALGSHLMKHLQEKTSLTNIIKLSMIMLVLTSLLYASFNIYLVGIGIIVISIQCGGLFPLANAYLVENCPKDQKSTILSIFSFGFTLGYASFAMGSGILLDTLGIHILYYITIGLILLLSIYALCYRGKLKN